MKDIFLALLVFTVPITCTVFAGLLALQSKKGWGWFLLIALLFAGSIKITTH